MRAGINYGWPVISYGEEYGGGPIGEGIQRKAGMAQPLYYWTPSIAPSGMTFYSGAAMPRWQGNIFSGALALKHLNRLVIEGERVIHEERLLAEKCWRVRFVEEGPDGYLYFGVDDGMVMRLRDAGADFSPSPE
jgi:glucose/arabinose dehydrogenase